MIVSDEKTPEQIAEEIKITFPCEYPVRIVGDAVENFREKVIAVITKHAPDFDEASIKMRDSKNGNYQSLSLIITATGKPQLQALFDDLKATGIVRMVL